MLLLATADHTGVGGVPTPEELPALYRGFTGEENALVRADMVFFSTSAGGAVFSTGSIAWCCSLSHNGYDNNVSRITGNILRRFLQPEQLYSEFNSQFRKLGPRRISTGEVFQGRCHVVCGLTVRG